VSKPKTHFLEEIPHGVLPFSGVTIFGPQHVTTGIEELIERGFLKQVTVGEDEDMLVVFYPTPALVSHIMEKQGVS
jgi:hypothetical protein